VTREQAIESTGWALKISDKLKVTQPPTIQELQILRSLNAPQESKQ